MRLEAKITDCMHVCVMAVIVDIRVLQEVRLGGNWAKCTRNLGIISHNCI